jgi:hypothetical protein
MYDIVGTSAATLPGGGARGRQVGGTTQGGACRPGGTVRRCITVCGYMGLDMGLGGLRVN